MGVFVLQAERIIHFLNKFPSAKKDDTRLCLTLQLKGCTTVKFLCSGGKFYSPLNSHLILCNYGERTLVFL